MDGTKSIRLTSELVLFFLSIALGALLTFTILSNFPLHFDNSYVSDVLLIYGPERPINLRNSTFYLLTLFLIPLFTCLFFFFMRKRQINTLLQKSRRVLLSAILILFISEISGAIIILKEGFRNFDLYKSAFLFINPVIFNPVFIIVNTLTITAALFLFLSHKNINILRKSSIQTILTICILIIIAFTLFDRTFENKYMFAPHTIQYFHTVPLLSPVADIIKGKVLLVDSISQYGLFIVYLPAIILKIVGNISFTSFFYLMIILGILYYFAVFFLLKKMTSPLLAVFGILSLLTLHFYFQKDRYIHPIAFPLRYLLDIPFFLLLLYISKNPRKERLIVPIFAAFAIFYNFESGFAISIAYIAFSVLRGIDIFRGNIRKITTYLLERIFLLLINSCLIIVLYGLYAKIISGQFPDWNQFFFYLGILGRHISIDYPLVDFHIFYLLIYLIFLSKAVVSVFLKKLDRITAWESALSIYGLVIFDYYIEKGYIINLVAVSLPAIILFIISIHYIYKITKEENGVYMKFFFLGPWIILSSVLIFSIYFYIYRFSTNSSYDYWTKKSDVSEKMFKQMNDSSKLLTKYEPFSSRVALLSFHDTLLGLLTDKVNLLPYSTSQNLVTYSQIANVFSLLKKIKPKYVYADSEIWLKSINYPDIYSNFYPYLSENYEVINKTDMLEVWRLKH